MGLLSAFRRTFAGGETRARASSLGIRDDAGTARRWPRFEDLLEDPARVDTSEPPALAADDPFADDVRTWWRDGFVVKKSFAPASEIIVAMVSGVEEGASGAVTTPIDSAPRNKVAYSMEVEAQTEMASRCLTPSRCRLAATRAILFTVSA